MPYVSIAKARNDKRFRKNAKKAAEAYKNLKLVNGKAYVRRRAGVGAAGAVEVDVAAGVTAKFK